ncbi:MAG TPA: urease subunit beta [Gemmatimonadaceae bacterium]
MPLANDVAQWVAPPPPASVVADEAFDVGEPTKIGAIDFGEGSIEINAGRETKEIEITSTGDRPVQIGAHCHLFEVNRVLAFDREAAFGFRLDIPSGSSVRFEPGQSRKCQITRFGGVEVSMGMNDLTNGSMRSELTRAAALERARQSGYRVEEPAP